LENVQLEVRGGDGFYIFRLFGSVMEGTDWNGVKWWIFLIYILDMTNRNEIRIVFWCRRACDKPYAC
jgi:hypothetical protein